MKTQTNILQVIGGMNMGGAEMFLMNTLRKIDREKYRFVFLCYKDGNYDFQDEIEALGSKIVRIQDTRVSNPLKFVKSIEKVIENESIDVVHSHVDFSSGYAMVAAKNAKISIKIAHAHSTSAHQSDKLPRRLWFNILKWQMNHNATYRIACSDDAGHFMFGKNSFQVIRNGIDIKRFQYDTTSRKYVRQKYSIGHSDVVLLHAGRFEEVKNHTFLIDIFYAYLKRNPTAKLLLIGDGSLFTSTKMKVASLGLNEKVIFLGKQSNTEDYYSAADIFVMPSLYEGIPVTLIEAQSSGLPCIVSDTIDQSVNYSNIQFIPLSKTADEWATTIENLPISRNSISPELTNDYDMEVIVKTLEEIYA